MTLQQVADLRAEGDALHAFLATLPEDQWSRETPFKNRTINWVVRHLHDAGPLDGALGHGSRRVPRVAG